MTETSFKLFTFHLLVKENRIKEEILTESDSRINKKIGFSSKQRGTNTPRRSQVLAPGVAASKLKRHGLCIPQSGFRNRGGAHQHFSQTDQNVLSKKTSRPANAIETFL